MAIRMSGLMSGMDTEAVVKELMEAQSLKKQKVVKAKTKLEWKQTKWADLNTKLKSLYNNYVSKMQLTSTYKAKKATISDSSVASVSAGNNAVNGSYTMEVKNIATTQYLTGAKIAGGESLSTKLVDLDSSLDGAKIEIKSGDKSATLQIDENTTISDFVSQLKNAGLNASYDTAQKRFFISSKESGVENSFSINATMADGTAASLAGLGLKNIDVDSTTGAITIDGSSYTADTLPKAEDMGGMALIAASDSKVLLNGAELTSKNSTISANGLTINLVGKTKPGEAVTFSVANDVDGVYNTIKDFLKEYNSIMKEMNTLYGAASSKGYEPLTSEEKDAMSDSEVEEWEKKIKDSLLRRDSNLNSIIQGMRSAMMTTVEHDGKKYALSSFGIMTSTDYTEGGLLHIYGDSDDSVFSDKDDKLKKALEENPDAVVATLSGVFTNLAKTMRNQMAGNQYRSALTFYDDIQMNKDIKAYEKDIKTWEDKLATMEDAYYKKFTAMESAMAKLQSMQSSLAGLFGNS